MIDLDAAATELGESLAHVRPDVERVRARAGRRQRTRRIAGGLAALVLLAGGAAAASGIAGDEEAREAVITGPGPSPDSAAGETDGDELRTIDLGDLRVRVPASWRTIESAFDPTGCGGPKIVVIGDPAPNAFCPEPTALRIALLQEPLDGGGDDPQTLNGIALVRLAAEPTPVWAAPDLGVRLSFGDGVDSQAILGTIGPSARQTALADVANGGVPLWQADPSAWKEVTYEGVAIQVPAAWPDATGAEYESSIDPCLEWLMTGPTVMRGRATIPCRSDSPSNVRDGAWLLPLADGEVDTGDGSWEELELGGLGGGEWTPIVQVHSTSTVLRVVVPLPDAPPILLLIGLGEDGHIAGSILSSIRLDDTEPGPNALVLPCGTVAVPDRTVLDLPEDLVVDPQPGMGGWAPGTGEEVCAANLTDPEDPASHVTFLDGDLPYAITSPRREPGPRMLTWGEIEDGFGGGYTNADGEFVAVLAYGLSEEGAALLFSSLAAS